MKNEQIPDSWERVGESLRQFWQMRGYKPEEFAKELGISRSYLLNIAAGRKRLTPQLLARASEALGVPQIALMNPKSDQSEREAVTS